MLLAGDPVMIGIETLRSSSTRLLERPAPTPFLDRARPQARALRNCGGLMLHRFLRGRGYVVEHKIARGAPSSSAVIRKPNKEAGRRAGEARGGGGRNRREERGTQRRFRAEGSSAFSPRHSTGQAPILRESILGPDGEPNA
jgi:hypothetical protein